MAWPELVAVAADLFEAETRRDRARDNAGEAKPILDNAAKQLEGVSAEARQFLGSNGLKPLAGRFAAELAGAIRYARDPMHEHLVDAAVRGLRAVFEETSEYAADTIAAENLAFEAFPPCVISAGAAALLMTDAKHRYAIKGSMAGLFGRTLMLATRMEAVLRRRSDARFRGVVFQNTEPGFVEVGYVFNGVFELVAIIPSNGNPAAARQQTLEEMGRRQEQVFADFPGVRELRRILAAAAAGRDSLEAEVVPVRAEGLADVVLDSAAGPPFRFRLA